MYFIQENENLLSFANGVWSKKEFFDQLELDKVIQDLDENQLADFQLFGSNPVSEINEWVELLTRGKIKKLVGQFKITKSKKTILKVIFNT